MRSAGRPPPHFTLLSSRAVSHSIFYGSEPSEPFHPTFLCKPSSSPRRSWGWAGMHRELSRVPIVRKSGPAVSSLTAPGSWPPPLSLQLQKKEKERAHRTAGPELPLSYVHARRCAHVHKQHAQLSSQEQSSIMNKDMQLDRECLHTHLAHPVAHNSPPCPGPQHLRSPHPGPQACGGQSSGAQDCPSLLEPSVETCGPVGKNIACLYHIMT